MFRQVYGYLSSDMDSDVNNGIESLYKYSGWDFVSGRDAADLENKIERMGGGSIFSGFDGSFDFQGFLGDIHELFMNLSYNLHLRGYNLLDIKTIDLLDVDVNKRVLYFDCKVMNCDSSCRRVFNSDFLKKLFKDVKMEVDCQLAEVVSISFKRDTLILEVGVFGG